MTCAIVTIVRTNWSGERPASEPTLIASVAPRGSPLAARRHRPGRGTVPFEGAGAGDRCVDLGYGLNRNVCPLGVAIWGVSQPAGAVTARRAPTLAG